MSRPPQAAQYLFLLDVSYNAVQSGYLHIVADELKNEFRHLPGDKRTSIGFLCFDSALHFFNINEDMPQPQQLSVSATVLDLSKAKNAKTETKADHNANPSFR